MELTDFGAFTIELGSKRIMERLNLVVASCLPNSLCSAPRCPGCDPLPQSLTISLPLERESPARSWAGEAWSEGWLLFSRGT